MEKKFDPPVVKPREPLGQCNWIADDGTPVCKRNTIDECHAIGGTWSYGFCPGEEETIEKTDD